MKISKLFAPLLVGILAHAATVYAGDLYAVTIAGTCKMYNDAGRAVVKPLNNGTILRAYAATQEMGLTLRQLKLVYDTNGDGKISIVGTNGTNLLDVATFGFPIEVSNNTGTQRQRLVFLYLPTDVNAAGTALLSDRLVRDGEGNITKLTSTGRFQYAVAATDQIPGQACSGVIIVGRKLSIQSPPPGP